jgi:thymidylate kinase
MAELVVVTGPIGSGKSTVADGLATHLRDIGLRTVTVDLDELVGMVRAPDGDAELTWRQARSVHGELVAAWLRTGVDAVVAHGPFYTPDEIAPLLAPLPHGVSPRWLLLLAPYDVALARVAGDDRRGISRDPDFLRATHRRFGQLLPRIPRCEWTFDTAITSADEIVRSVAADLCTP